MFINLNTHIFNIIVVNDGSFSVPFLMPSAIKEKICETPTTHLNW